MLVAVGMARKSKTEPKTRSGLQSSAARGSVEPAASSAARGSVEPAARAKDAADERVAAAPPGLTLGAAESEPETATVKRERRRVALAVGCTVSELQCTLGGRLHSLETSLDRLEVLVAGLTHGVAESGRRASLLQATVGALALQVSAKRESTFEEHHIGDAEQASEPDAECSPCKPRPPRHRRLRRAEGSGPLFTDTDGVERQVSVAAEFRPFLGVGLPAVAEAPFPAAACALLLQDSEGSQGIDSTTTTTTTTRSQALVPGEAPCAAAALSEGDGALAAQRCPPPGASSHPAPLDALERIWGEKNRSSNSSCSSSINPHRAWSAR